MNNNSKLLPIHPGEILLEEFLIPMNIQPEKLAKDINISTAIITEIIAQKTAINPEIALRLSKYFSMSEKFWLNLQTKYDLEVTKDILENRLDEEVKPLTLGEV